MRSQEWLSAVSSNDLDSSISLAGKLVPTPPMSTPQEHIVLSEREGIKAVFLTAPFNLWDFKLWRDAYFLHQLSLEVVGGDSNDIQTMFEAVCNRIEATEPEGCEPAFPCQIWQRGYGHCDRQAWVLCELAYQAGWETQVVYLRNPGDETDSPHTICELRRPTGLVWFADPHGNILFPKKSIEDVASDDTLLQTLWPNNPDRRPALKNCVFWTPSYPQDYCPRNQQLQIVLREALGNSCPRFGDPPDQRLMRYQDLGQWHFPMELWFYPFRLLKNDILRRALSETRKIEAL